MRYVYVENGQIASEHRVLPNSWSNISNFDILDADSLKQFGWYPYRFVGVTIPSGYKIDGSYYEITDDEVLEIQTTRPLTDEEQQTIIDSHWANIRSRRDIELNESDWTQLSDSPLTAEKKEEFKVYRQELRDITKYDSPYDVVWPEHPQTVQLAPEPESPPLGPSVDGSNG